MINQIFTEIIDNAIKYTIEGAVLIKQFINEDDNLTISIKDTGIGISQEYLKQILSHLLKNKPVIQELMKGTA